MSNNKAQPLHPDISYIENDEIGKVICKGLAEVAKIRPQNPVDYLAKWLLSYQSQSNVQKSVSFNIKKLKFLD